MPLKTAVNGHISPKEAGRIALGRAKDIQAIADFKAACLEKSFSAFLSPAQVQQEIAYLSTASWVEKQILHPEAALLVSKMMVAIDYFYVFIQPTRINHFLVGLFQLPYPSCFLFR